MIFSCLFFFFVLLFQCPWVFGLRCWVPGSPVGCNVGWCFSCLVSVPYLFFLLALVAVLTCHSGPLCWALGLVFRWLPAPSCAAFVLSLWPAMGTPLLWLLVRCPVSTRIVMLFLLDRARACLCCSAGRLFPLRSHLVPVLLPSRSLNRPPPPYVVSSLRSAPAPTFAPGSLVSPLPFLLRLPAWLFPPLRSVWSPSSFLRSFSPLPLHPTSRLCTPAWWRLRRSPTICTLVLWRGLYLTPSTPFPPLLPPDFPHLPLLAFLGLSLPLSLRATPWWHTHPRPIIPAHARVFFLTNGRGRLAPSPLFAGLRSCILSLHGSRPPHPSLVLPV